jgi:hypothetical protein
MLFEYGELAVPLTLSEDSSPKAVDDFKSVLIIAYEQALEEGMSPGAAIGIVLDWVSLELRRCTQLCLDGV